MLNHALDQEVDGSTLVMLANSGTVEQLKLCGFKTVKQQLHLRKLLLSTNLQSTTPGIPVSAKAGKLTLSAIKDMSPEDKHLYLIK